MLEKQKEAIEQAISKCSNDLRNRSTFHKGLEEDFRKRVYVKRINVRSNPRYRKTRSKYFSPYDKRKEEVAFDHQFYAEEKVHHKPHHQPIGIQHDDVIGKTMNCSSTEYSKPFQSAAAPTFMGELLNLEHVSENFPLPFLQKGTKEAEALKGEKQEQNLYSSSQENLIADTESMLSTLLPQGRTYPNRESVAWEPFPYFDPYAKPIANDNINSAQINKPCPELASNANNAIWNPACDNNSAGMQECPFAEIPLQKFEQHFGCNSSADENISSTNDSMNNEGETPSLTGLSESEDVVPVGKILKQAERNETSSGEDKQQEHEDTTSSEDDHNETTSDEEEGEVNETDNEIQALPKKSTSSSTVCLFDYDKNAIPFKKRKRMRQMRYPKSRFIDWRKIPIFDLTMEEEFRIYNIDFRRNLVWKEYIRLMKNHSPGFDSFKTQIFLSAFGLKRVVLNPDDWIHWTKASMENHAKSAEIFEEVNGIPPKVWEKIKLEGSKTFSTYGWSLCWANADSGDLIGQESKAGFWDKELQVPG